MIKKKRKEENENQWGRLEVGTITRWNALIWNAIRDGLNLIVRIKLMADCNVASIKENKRGVFTRIEQTNLNRLCSSDYWFIVFIKACDRSMRTVSYKLLQ